MTDVENAAEALPGAAPRRLITPVEVAELIEFVNSPSRRVPVVIMSPARGSARYPVSPSELADELNTTAQVHVIDTSALCWELDGHPGLRTYGGAVRVVGANGFSAVIRTDGDPDHAFDRILDATESAARRMPQRRSTPPPPTACTNQEQPGVGGDAAFLDHLTVVARERAARKKAEERAAGATKDLASARSEITRLRAEIDTENLPLFSDPEEQFRDDVQRTWLRQVSEHERGSWPLRDFRLGPEFLSNLDIPQAPRKKIIEVVVDVLTRRAFDMTSRAVRAHGNGGSAGTNGQLVRSDGAAGYRCNIRMNTPQAPRLMWWELTDGTVELALAGRHDDPMPTN
jgi:hypothetical protein